MSIQCRIVRDKYLGFEVQHRRWWWPFWTQSGFSNTHMSQQAAEQWADDHFNREVKRFRVSNQQPEKAPCP